MAVAQDLRISKPLTQFMVDFLEEAEAFANMLIMPPLPSNAVKTIHYSGDKGKLRRLQGVKRGQGNPPTNVDGQISQVESTSEERSARSTIDLQERDTWEPGSLGPDQFHMNLITQGLMQEKEHELADVMRDPTSWPAANVTTPSNLWDTAAGDPAGDIISQMSLVRKGALRKANLLVVSDDAWVAIQKSENVRTQINPTMSGVVTEELFASLIGVEKVFVMSAVTVATNEGQTDVESFIWTGDTFLLYVNPNLRGAITTFGLTREFKPMRGFNEPKTDSLFDEVTGLWHYDQLFINFAAGVFFDQVIS